VTRSNPFRVSGAVVGEYFTDRAEEIRRIRAALVEPQAKLLVYGPRRMGKSSAIEVAVRGPRGGGPPAVVADLSSATTLSDAATRILQAATRQLRSAWATVVSDLVRHLEFSVTVVHGPGGHHTLTLDVSHRSRPVEEQQTTLGEALDAIDALAAEKGQTIGIVLDEFQEIHRLGGERAAWHLRGVIQRHEHVSYVLAGSKESLIVAMTGRDQAFYGLFEMLRFGPIDEDHLARWIEARMESHGVRARGLGRRIVELGRPRTRDIVQVARVAFQLAAPAGRLRPGEVERALDQVVDEEDDLLRAEWERLTVLQQNVLRAVAAGERRLYSEGARRRYGLRGTSYVAAALDALIERDLVVKRGEGEYAFDSPFMRRWVQRHALPDVGIFPSPSEASDDAPDDGTDVERPPS
jgi:hypothetical protein